MNDNGAEPSLRRKERSMKIDWIRKLTSRKFWAAIATFVSMMIVALGKSQETATQGRRLYPGRGPGGCRRCK